MRKSGLSWSPCRSVCVFVALIAACSPRTDIVARHVARDAQVEAGCSDAASCDAAVNMNCDGGACAPGTCSAAACTSIANTATFCSAAQPASVTLGDGCDAAGHATFRYAVCACGDLITNSSLEIDALDGTAVPASASISINDELRLGPDTNIDGSVYVTGRYGAATPPRLTGSLIQNAEPSCACDATDLLDIPALISARANDNDDALLGLTARTLENFGAERSLTLDCGRYYFDRVAGGRLAIEARGRIAVFIAGNLALDGGLFLTLQDTARAEIFVGGNVQVSGRLELGTSNDGNRVLLAVHGNGTVNLEDAVLDGTLYAPRAELVTRGPFELHGSLFVNRANFGAPARIHYQPLAAAQTTCAP